MKIGGVMNSVKYQDFTRISGPNLVASARSLGPGRR